MQDLHVANTILKNFVSKYFAPFDEYSKQVLISAD